MLNWHIDREENKIIEKRKKNQKQQNKESICQNNLQ